MLGIILLLALFSVLIFLIEKKYYDVFGLMPTQKRMTYFFAGFLVSAILVGINVATETIFCSIVWKMRVSAHYFEFGLVAWKFFIAVLTEELVFRGIIIYILMRKIKTNTSMLISSALFGFYHWFSYEMFGSGIVPMLYIFLITAMAGYCWAYAYIKSGTLLLPLGLHFGWNCINWLFAEKSAYGQGFFIRATEMNLTNLQNLSLSLFTGFVPTVIMYFALRFYFAERSVLNMNNSL